MEQIEFTENIEKIIKRLEEYHGEPIVDLGGDYMVKSLYDECGFESIDQANRAISKHGYHCNRCYTAIFVECEVSCKCAHAWYCETCGGKEDTWHSIDEEGAKLAECCIIE